MSTAAPEPAAAAVAARVPGPCPCPGVDRAPAYCSAATFGGRAVGGRGDAPGFAR